MSRRQIETQEQYDQLIGSLDWTESYIQELYLQSPTYSTSDDKYIVAFAAQPDVLILFSTPADEAYSGVEFRLEGVSELHFFSRIEARPSGKIKALNASVELSFNTHKETWIPDIQATKLSYQLLEKSMRGRALRYGKEFLFDEGGVRIDKKES